MKIEHQSSNSSLRVETISRFRKERFLKSLSEAQFRDEIVRPIFLRKGLKDGRDLCGEHEEGKDCTFYDINPLGIKVLYVVQTKKGNLNLSKHAATNVIEAITQLKTALQTKVLFTANRERLTPTYAILCTSGKINENARNHIINEIKDPRIHFLDKDDLIPEIDNLYPELWLGIDANKFPYLKKLKENLADPNESIALSDVIPSNSAVSAVTDEMFVPLHLIRVTSEIKKYKGQVRKEPKFEQLPVHGILSKKDRLFLILGEAGAGKSTSLRRLTYSIANKSLSAEEEKGIEIPILLRAIDIARENKRIVDICASETIKFSPVNKPCFSTKDLYEGRVLLLVDALDEISHEDGRKYILNALREFHEQYPHCKIIITSREYSFIKELDELAYYRTYRLSPIDWKQADKIIQRLHSGKALSKEPIQEMLRRLQDVHGIELSPLLVTVFVATSDYSKSDIPANITELFKKYAEMMLGRWDTSKGLSQQYQAPLKDFLLQKVAFEMHRRKATALSLEELRKILTFELESRGQKKADVNQLIDEMLYRSGLFRFIGEHVEFRHMLIQEFFAGRGIAAPDFLQSIISDEWWQRAIVFYFGERPDSYVTLESVTQSLGKRTSKEIFQAAVVIGLALQACYLVHTKDKVNLLRWVIEMLSITKDDIFDGEETKFPLTRFIHYYLFGRDAVACNILADNIREIKDAWDVKLISQEDKDMHIFWCIIGLIECGCMKDAEKLVKSFHPSDHRLLLAIHLGCFLISHLRISTKEQKEIAERLMNKLNPFIQHLRDQLLKEVHTELLEIQKGEVKQIEFKKTS